MTFVETKHNVFFMLKHDLNPDGVRRLCIQVLIHSLRDFERHRPYYASQTNRQLVNIHRDYMERIMFIRYSPIVVHTLNVMEYDVDKVRDEMIKIVDKKYEQALNYYANLQLDKPYL